MLYSIKNFHNEYPDDDACLAEIFRQKYKDLKNCPNCKESKKFYRVSDRKCFACQHCGYQLHPLANTIFHKSSTPLKLWFYAIFLVCYPNNGLSIKELERQLGVTYKTAWRISKEIKQLV